MSVRQTVKSLRTSQSVRLVLLVIGVTLMIAAPLVGLLPGPGGIFVFAIGLGLALKNSAWAKRRYVEFKRHHPKPASLADWGMRRRSAKQRSTREKVKTD